MTIKSSLPYIILLGGLYGTTMVASRFIVGLVRPVTYIGLRMLLASLGFLLIYSLRLTGKGFPHDRHLWKQASLLAVFGTILPMLMIITSLQYQSSGITSVLVTTGPAVTLLMAHWSLRDERLNPAKSVGIVLALSGALLLALRGESGLPDLTAASPLGYGLVMIGIVSGSVMTIYARKRMGNCDVFDVAGIRVIVSALIMVPWMLVYIRDDFSAMTGTGWLVLLYTALAGTFFSIMLDFYNIKHFGATASALVSYVVPIVAGIAGVLLLKETVTSGMLVGMALILLGVGLINFIGNRSRTRKGLV